MRRPDTLDPADLGALLVEVTAQHDRLAAIRARLTAAHDRLAAWQADGARSQKAWLVDRCRLSPGVAGRQSRDARHLAELPRTADAFAHDAITAAQAATAAAAARDLPADALAGLDRLMVSEGPLLDPGRLRTAVNDYVHRAEPDALADREARAHRLRRLTITRTHTGAVTGDFLLDPVAGETLLTAIAAHTAPGGTDDLRTPEQRRADALTTLAHHHLNNGTAPIVGGVRPHVTVVVDAATLHHHTGAPPAQLDRLGALSTTAARQLTCDPTLTRVTTTAGGSQPAGGGVFARVVGAAVSQPLDVGRASRVVTVAQRRALAVRDKGCIGCAAPVAWCEAHHVRHWVDGGP